VSSAATLDLARLSADLASAAGIGIGEAAQAALAEGATFVASQMAVYAPRRTGALIQSITISYPDPFTAVVGPTVDYAVYQEFGTHGPYKIRPRTPGGYLVFYIGGRKIVTREVTHPGVPPHPFARPAAADAAEQLAGRLAGAGSKLMMGR